MLTEELRGISTGDHARTRSTSTTPATAAASATPGRALIVESILGGLAPLDDSLVMRALGCCRTDQQRLRVLPHLLHLAGPSTDRQAGRQGGGGDW